MTSHCRNHRLDGYAVRSPEDAIDTLLLATADGTEEGVVIACVDRRLRPLTMFCITGRGEVEDAVEIILPAAAAADSPLSGVFLGTCRPEAEARAKPRDVESWYRMTEFCGELGVELLGWFIVSNGVARPVTEHPWPAG
jgi:hypothetical protein